MSSIRLAGDTLPAFEVTGVKPGFHRHEENGASAFETLRRDSFPGQWRVILEALVSTVAGKRQRREHGRRRTHQDSPRGMSEEGFERINDVLPTAPAVEEVRPRHHVDP